MVMRLWDRVMKILGGANTGSVFNDTNMRAVGNNCIQKLMVDWVARCGFDRMAGMRTNKKKTKVYANPEGLENKLRKALKRRGDGSISLVREFVLVGKQMVARGAPGPGRRAARRKQVVGDLQRI